MNGPFEAYIKNLSVNTFTFEDAARYYLSEKHAFVHPKDIRIKLEASTKDSGVVAAANEYLIENPEALEGIFRELLKWAWDQGDAEVVARVIEAANQKLGWLDRPSYAMLGMYAMWLLATGGRETTITTVERPDGSTYSMDVHYASAPLGSLLKLIALHPIPDEDQIPPRTVKPQKQESKKPPRKLPKN